MRQLRMISFKKKMCLFAFFCFLMVVWVHLWVGQFETVGKNKQVTDTIAITCNFKNVLILR